MSLFVRRRHRVLWVGVLAATAVARGAAAADSSGSLDTVTVTATRVAMSSFDIPAAISTV
jgi:outer membrane receptor protein involved in Fe transport